MKRIVIFAMVMATALSASGKTTYIPTYKSYIHIVSGTDTISTDGNLADMELQDREGLFTIRIEHEEVTQEKVKAIKRAKRMAGWAMFSAVVGSMSAAFSKNSLQYCVRRACASVATDLAGIYAINAKNEQALGIDVYVDNISQEELQVNDQERGLTWYIRPGEALHLTPNNPDALQLRVSTLRHDRVRYVSALAGSAVKKWTVGWENPDCWIVEVIKVGESPEIYDELIGYRRISKEDFTEQDISIEDFRAFKKLHK